MREHGLVVRHSFALVFAVCFLFISNSGFGHTQPRCNILFEQLDPPVYDPELISEIAQSVETVSTRLLVPSDVQIKVAKRNRTQGNVIEIESEWSAGALRGVLGHELFHTIFGKNLEAVWSPRLRETMERHVAYEKEVDDELGRFTALRQSEKIELDLAMQEDPNWSEEKAVEWRARWTAGLGAEEQRYRVLERKFFLRSMLAEGYEELFADLGAVVANRDPKIMFKSLESRKRDPSYRDYSPEYWQGSRAEEWKKSTEDKFAQNRPVKTTLLANAGAQIYAKYLSTENTPEQTDRIMKALFDTVHEQLELEMGSISDDDRLEDFSRVDSERFGAGAVDRLNQSLIAAFDRRMAMP